MMRRLIPILVWCALFCGLSVRSSLATEASKGPATVWTAIIPDGFPGYVYTWHMKDDGTYREEGRDKARGTPIQPTMFGRWSREAARMLLKQDDQPFVFDGVVLDGLYAGTLYFHGRAYSRFCAAKGELAPKRCDTSPGIAMVVVKPAY
jgi:hypothetical protein